MNSVIGFWERTYKFWTYLIVAAVTLGTLIYYWSLEDKSATFEVATLYATFTFVVGIYLSNMEKVIAGKIYSRKETYLELNKLITLLKKTTETLDTNDDIRSAVIFFQVFTSRAEGMKEANVTPIISEKGFKFTRTLLKAEDKYTKLCDELQKKITKAINQYAVDNNIQLRTGKFYELSLLHTNYDEWCNENVITVEKREEFKEYIYSFIQSQSDSLDEVDKACRKLKNQYLKCLEKARVQYKLIEDTYGQQLQHIINNEYNIQVLMESIQQLLKTNHSETSRSLYSIAETLEDIRTHNTISFNNIQNQISNMEDNLISAVDALHED